LPYKLLALQADDFTNLWLDKLWSMMASQTW
jgi:hypothetical protein